ncbi:helix-turn-helix domain-containing protein [Corynebacterium variabile]|uniref:Helix-turn-helix domain n=5 Tax=Corynebacterium TaxID=1716 RepID=A0A0X2NN68_9CORY|nr:helix-turn-helix domain-containing protein [Corynebacterium variabile]AEK35507.1 ArsR DNA-binding transcription regulator [Corynebacterium variabile DSM 44702]CUU66198.1 Helix-turn-helix domain [Corynebacterium variabile]
MSSVTEPSPRGRVLAAVEDAHTRTGDAVTAAELADTLDLHPSTVGFHLRKLLDAGQIVEGSADTTDRRGRPRKRYRPAPATPTDTLLIALVEALADTDDEREERAAQAGRIWASSVVGSAVDSPVGSALDAADPLDAAAAVLTALGFEIQSMSSIFGTSEIRVCSCPLRILGQRHPEVARGIQRGAVEFALTGLAGSTGSTAAGTSDGWTVTSRPDPRFGDCEVALRLAPTAPASTAPTVLPVPTSPTN